MKWFKTKAQKEADAHREEAKKVRDKLSETVRRLEAALKESEAPEENA